VNKPDTTGFTLVSHVDYYKKSMIHEFPLCGFHLDSGWHLWQNTLPKEQRALSENLNLGNGVIFVNHQEDKTEIIEFAAQADNSSIFQFYMNNTNLLKKFMIYFKQQAAELIAEAQNQDIKPLASMVLENKLKKVDTLKNLPDMDTILYEASHPINTLSKREIECFYYLIKGCSISEISKEISLAIPTISNYIIRVKQKLKCSSRQELVQKAHELGFIEYYFSINTPPLRNL
jgi:DNA-binding CsgD family transcriptional regulator